MIRPGAMLKQLLSSLTKKPATQNYPADKSGMPKGFRGKLKFDASKCIGCKMCMRDCPTGAIEIKEAGEKKFVAEVDLGKCIYCGQCVDSCLKKALGLTSEFELAQLDPKKLKVTLDAGDQEVSGK
ncbi:MAG: 4Fe-4S binding protein [Candidatus Omnitrophota bacterium]|jgi:formate hydrogenlyase subunit 6/NADH:ubiquinone oxidoreductase subunit I